jgi:single-strand DNA-binding protein
MPNFNRVIILGNLTKDPDLKYTPTGTPLCNFVIAINSFFKDSKGVKQEEATFVPVTVWKKQAETVAEYLKKGRPVLIEGRLKQERWKNKEDGKDRSRMIVVASIVRFLGKPPQGQDVKPPIQNEEPPEDQHDEDIPF